MFVWAAELPSGAAIMTAGDAVMKSLNAEVTAVVLCFNTSRIRSPPAAFITATLTTLADPSGNKNIYL